MNQKRTHPKGEVQMELSDSKNIKIQIQDAPETDRQYALKFDGNDDWINYQTLNSSKQHRKMWLKIPKVGEGLL